MKLYMVLLVWNILDSKDLSIQNSLKDENGEGEGIVLKEQLNAATLWLVDFSKMPVEFNDVIDGAYPIS